MNALQLFQKGLTDNLAGKGGVAASICSAHPEVLRALFRSAHKFETFALIESTSNQVDQYGGYTGMKPVDFVGAVYRIADEEQFPVERILLGGDHLGTNTWRTEGEAKAMVKAKVLVSEYVKAGYKKIHLDASFVCAGDIMPLSDEIVARRSAELAAVCEQNAGDDSLLYVIGTEVPTPGGVYGDETLHITTSEDVKKTLEVFNNGFYEKGLQSAWERVVGVVIQPGVEFGDEVVHDYNSNPELASTIEQYNGLAYEAHSTDYQTPVNLQKMVNDHFYILKVGPWLTFGLREGLYGLELIEQELNPSIPSTFRHTLIRVMKDDDKYWRNYYHGLSDEVERKLFFSYSDRARYYLGQEDVKKSIERLKENLSPVLPESLLSQYLPEQYGRVKSGTIENSPQDVLIDKISTIVDCYLQTGEA